MTGVNAAPLVCRPDHWTLATVHAGSCLPEEACGLLAGKAGQVERVVPITNAAHSRTRFRMDPEEQVQALLSLEEGGFELLAIYHSHPEGPSGLSAIDLAECAYPEAAQVVLSSPEKGWSARTFRVEGKAVIEIELQIEDRTAGN